MNIGDAIKAIANTHNEIYCKVCVVDDVDEQTRTVDVSPLDESAPILGVALQATEQGEKGFVSFPKLGTHVVVAFINDAIAVVVLMEEVTKHLCVIGDKKPVEITAEDNTLMLTLNGTTIQIAGDKKITLNDGENGGLVLSEITAERLAKLESDVNALKNVFKSWVPAPTDGGAALKTLVTAWSGQTLVVTKKIDLENKDIKH